MSAFTLSPSLKFADVLSLREKAIASGVYAAEQCDNAVLDWRRNCNGNAPSADEVLAAVGAGKIPAPLGVALLPTAKSNGVLKCKVSVKGAVSVYGINRMPVSLYAEQWKRLTDYIPTVMAFIKDNDGKEFTVEEYGKDGKKTGRTVKSKIKYKE